MVWIGFGPRLSKSFVNCMMRLSQTLLNRSMYTTSQQTISLVVSWDTIGSINTSLTGFTFELYAGSIHLAVLGKLLTSSGFTHWDLGTGFEYKQRLGAVRIEREE
ncbi:hypothetical protein QTG54_011519, partial [Skeletonema marinoi]